MNKYLFPSISITLIVISVFLNACHTSQPHLSSLQIEVMETRTFNTNKRTAFNAVVTVFQNMGYIINSSNFNTGFITAQSAATTTSTFGTSPTTTNSINDALEIAGDIAEITGSSSDTYQDSNVSIPEKTTSIQVTAFLTSLNNKSTKIRINFVRDNSTSNTGTGTTVKNTPIQNAEDYQNAFNKIRQQIFVSTGMKH